MTRQNGAAITPHRSNRLLILLVVLFLLITIAGLSYVKWWPYYHKAINAINTHTIGSSILTNGELNPPTPSWSAAWDYAVSYYKAVWKAAVLGIVLGSLVQVLIPSGWLLRLLGRSSFKSTVIGGLAAVPGMMCSCCAAPIAVGLRKKNVSAGASLAFWLGNPLINPATLIFMTVVLSWKFTLIRIVFGLIITFGVSYFAGRLAGKVEVPEEVLEKTAQHEEASPMWKRWIQSMWMMIVHLVPAYFISVLVLGAVRAWLFPSLGSGTWDGFLMLVIFCIAGALFVIPTAAEIPIIQTFLSLGFAAGPAAALLVVLPAISLPSMLMIRRSFPGRVVAVVFVSVVVLGLMSGIVGALIL
ncbi:permease [Paenibacillus rhizovicinus]|uniref:Permease n=1 Tax=Paenibacillus rhizovicinus TaxID=2704463 RepID=A0A6C0NV61_9BACL|nr:permease [Paenibacillus rhizovicinus]QHW29816.1 permease [Paenibacillus rhizovicinus]